MKNNVTMNVHDLAYMLTAYERVGAVSESDLVELLADELLVDADIIGYYNDYLASVNRYDDYVRPIEELEDELCNMEPSEAFRLGFFSHGQFSWCDDYFKYDGYGNLVSYTESALLDMICEDTDFIKEYVRENVLSDYDDDEIAEIINECNELIRRGF